MRTILKIHLLVMCILLFASLQTSLAQESGGVEADALLQFNIGIITDGPLDGKPDMLRVFQDEIVRMAEGEFEVKFPQSMVLQADSTQNGVNQQLDTLLANPETDMIIALGMIGSTEAIKRTELNKPVIAPFVFDAGWQKAPLKDGRSGVDNLYYVNLDTIIDQELIEFRNIVPFKKIALLIDERDINGVPVFKKLASYLANEHSISVMLIPTKDSAEETLAQIPSDIGAAMVGPLWQMELNQLRVLSKGFIERDIAAFALANYDYVEEGFFATTMPDKALEQLARQVAINVQEILLGEDPKNLPVAFSKSQKLAILMTSFWLLENATGRFFGSSPSNISCTLMAI